MVDNHLADIEESGQRGDKKPTEQDNQGIFDERFEAATNQFVGTLVENGVNVHIIVAEDPSTGLPIVHCNGSTYTLLKILAKVKAKLANVLAQELDL